MKRRRSSKWMLRHQKSLFSIFLEYNKTKLARIVFKTLGRLQQNRVHTSLIKRYI